MDTATLPTSPGAASLDGSLHGIAFGCKWIRFPRMLASWHKSFERLQRNFESLAPGAGELTHYLVVAPFTMDRRKQWVFDGSLHVPPGLPPESELLGQHGGSFSAAKRLSDPPGGQQGWMGFFYGDGGAYRQFVAIAQQASQLIWQASADDALPDLRQRLRVALPLNAEAVDRGMSFGNDKALAERASHRWMRLVHEIAWIGGIGSPIGWPRRVWAGEEVLPYWSDEDLAENLKTWCGGAGYSKRLCEENTVPPERYFSVSMQDLFSASAAAIDRILELTKPDGTSKEPRNASESAQPVDLINQTTAAKLLRVSRKTIGRRIKENTIQRFSRGKVSKAEIIAKAELIRERK